MAMKRRGFLTLLGAAVAAPALPLAAPSLPSKFKVLAAAHAKKYPVVTVMGISKRMGVTPEQAEALMNGLVRDGALGPIKSGTGGHLRASSRVFQRSPASFYSAQPERMARQAEKQRRLVEEQPVTEAAKGPTWLRHLHQLCVKQGYTLQPRALAALA